MSVPLICNMEWPYVLDGSIDMDKLPARLGVVDTERGVVMSKRNDSEATGVKDVSHWDAVFSKNCGVGWGKLRGQLLAL